MVNEISLTSSTQQSIGTHLFSVSPSKLSDKQDGFVSMSCFFSLPRPSSAAGMSARPAALKLNASNNFTFLEPFESPHLGRTDSGGGKLLNKHNPTQRQQPYMLAKPKQTKPNSSSSSSSLADDDSTVSLSSNQSSGSSSVSSRPTHQNAILNRLSNISNSFRSIFVRPKHTKPVELGSFNHQRVGDVQRPPEEISCQSKLKINLFSVSNVGDANETSAFELNQKLEKIISRNVMIESYTDRLLKRTSPVKATTSSSASSSSISSMSSRASESSEPSQPPPPVKTTQHQRALLMSSHSPAQPIPAAAKIQLVSTSKWTCMVCLSKHVAEVKICSICGSANSDAVNSTKVATTGFGAKLLKKSEPALDKSRPLAAHNTNTSQHGGLMKTWTCTYCHYANDNLKVVCMNCRASKQQLTSNNNNKSICHQTLQAKRKPVSSVKPERLNRSNEENEEVLVMASSKRHKPAPAKESEQYCKSCMSCLDKPEQPELKVATPNNSCCFKPATKPLMDTPMRPDYFEKERQEAKWTCTACLVQNDESKSNCVCCAALKKTVVDQVDGPTPVPVTVAKKSSNMLFANSTAKWSCTTCLVLNNEEKTSCACCSTKRQEAAKSEKPLEAATPLSGGPKWSCSTCLVANEPAKDSCVCCATPRQSGKPASSKWSCTTCLVLNEAEKSICVCCSTSRSGGDESAASKTKFSSLVAAAASLTASNPTTSLTQKSISFGMSSANSTTAATIKFGATNLSFAAKPQETASAPSLLFQTKQISFGTSGDLNKPAEVAAPAPEPSKSFFGTSSASEPAKSLFGSSQPVTAPAKPFFSLQSEESKPEAPSFGQTSFFKQEPVTTTQSSFKFGAKTAPVDAAVNPVSCSFGNGPTSSSSSFLTISNPFAAPAPVKEAEPVKPAAPSIFTFGSTSAAAPVSQPTPTLLFGQTANNVTTSNSFFGSSTQSNMFGSNEGARPAPAASPFTFGASSSVQPPPAAAATSAPPVSFFGNSTNPAPAASQTGSVNVFGQLNQNATNSSSSFQFGQQQQQVASKPATFMFGESKPASSNELKHSASTSFFNPTAHKKPNGSNDENKPLIAASSSSNNLTGFNFGAQSTASSGFNFSASNTPLKLQQIQASQPSTPFVFGGLSSVSNVQQQASDSPSLTQLLGAPSTPSTANQRVIKKATRIRKK